MKTKAHVAVGFPQQVRHFFREVAPPPSTGSSPLFRVDKGVAPLRTCGATAATWRIPGK